MHKHSTDQNMSKLHKEYMDDRPKYIKINNVKKIIIRLEASVINYSALYKNYDCSERACVFFCELLNANVLK